jgi:hypothetical protein
MVSRLGSTLFWCTHVQWLPVFIAVPRPSYTSTVYLCVRLAHGTSTRETSRHTIAICLLRRQRSKPPVKIKEQLRSPPVKWIESREARPPSQARVIHQFTLSRLVTPDVLDSPLPRFDRRIYFLGIKRNCRETVESLTGKPREAPASPQEHRHPRGGHLD